MSTGKDAPQPEAGAEDTTTPADLPDGAETPQDEARRRFREALEAKNLAHHGSGALNPTVQHPHSAPAKPRKTFRRKSG